MNLLYLLGIGIAAAVAPCPLTTNLAAIGYLTRHVGSQRRVAWAAAAYTLGRMAAYVGLGLLLSLGLSQAPQVSYWLQEELPHYLAPILMIAGLVVLDCIPFLSIGSKPGAETTEKLGRGGIGGGFLLGVLFALALCPPSAALFFGVALPVAAQSGAGAWLGISFFGLGTALPVAGFALLLTCSAAKAAKAMQCLPRIQLICKYVSGGALLLLGAYMTITQYIL